MVPNDALKAKMQRIWLMMYVGDAIEALKYRNQSIQARLKIIFPLREMEECHPSYRQVSSNLPSGIHFSRWRELVHNRQLRTSEDLFLLSTVVLTLESFKLSSLVEKWHCERGLCNNNPFRHIPKTVRQISRTGYFYLSEIGEVNKVKRIRGSVS